MKKTLSLVCGVLLSWNAGALEVEGVKLDDNVQLGGTPLVLNGAGARSMLFFKVYVVGLYVAEKQQDADKILTDAKPKRIAMHIVVRDSGTDRFLTGFHRGIEKNQSEAELAALRARMAKFDQMFVMVKTVKHGDVIAFDWLPAEGTRVTLNGAELGRIDGGDFYRALLSIWIGGKPAADDVKRALLGG